MESHRAFTHNNTYKHVRGFTLPEVLIVIALIAVIGSFSSILSLGNVQSNSFTNERNSLVSILERARSQAINNMCFGSGCLDGKQHGVHINATNYILFQGGSFATRDSAVDENIPMQNPITSTGLQDIIFSQLSGDATSGTITVSDTSQHVSIISINSEGRISWTK